MQDSEGRSASSLECKLEGLGINRRLISEESNEKILHYWKQEAGKNHTSPCKCAGSWPFFARRLWRQNSGPPGMCVCIYVVLYWSQCRDTKSVQTVTLWGFTPGLLRDNNTIYYYTIGHLTVCQCNTQVKGQGRGQRGIWGEVMSKVSSPVLNSVQVI